MGDTAAVTNKKLPEQQKFQFGSWTISSLKSHILESEGKLKEKYELTLFFY